MLTVGKDTYVTVADADKYISDYYSSTDTRLATWNGLQESDKEVALRNACRHISNITFRGVSFHACQPLPFPRYFGVNSTLVYRTLYTPDAYLYPEIQTVPIEVLDAQIEEAFEIACPSSDSADHAAETGPVKSYSIGHLSETYKQAEPGSLDAELISQKARNLLLGFVGGSYDIV